LSRPYLSDDELRAIAAGLRVDIVEMVVRANSGHIDSSLSVVDLLTVLYFDVMNVRPADPDWPGRDRLVLSKGHAAPALYAVLARRGFFDAEELSTLRQPGSRLQGHPRLGAPGVDAPSGSLGQGLAVGAGMALAAAKVLGRPGRRVFVVLSDGELDEGETWEAIMFAGDAGLSNLTAVVDHNGLQYTGRVRPMLGAAELAGKLASFGWTAVEVDGHAIADLRGALRGGGDRGPVAVIARTVKGKGVSYMENSGDWHGRVPGADLARRALAELRAGAG
jgi:transketolase